MLSFFYRMITPWKEANKVQIFKNRVIGKIVNIIYPIYCKNNIRKDKRVNNNVLISLTTYPKRIKEVYYCLNSLLRQSIKPKEIILWLAVEQFPNREKSLPKRILKLKKYGLKIEFCDDLKSYKKIFYAAQKYSNYIIVTADDDTLYPEDWLEKMLDTHNEYKNAIVCYRAHEITIENGLVNPYSKWKGLSKDCKGPSMSLIAIGVGGILYPQKFFKDTKLDWNVIKENAPTTDDIWLKILEVRKRIPVVKVNENSKEWFTISKSQKSSLKEINVKTDNKNDKAIQKLMLYYDLTYKDFIDEY